MNQVNINTKKQKTVAIFDEATWVLSDILVRCFRIPEVMARVIEARQILNKYNIQSPPWMFGFINNQELFKSKNTPQLQIISLIVSIGLYDRLVRRIGTPQFLMGNSVALLVAGNITTFETSLVNLFYKNSSQKIPFVMYKKNKKNTDPFSVCSLPKKSKNTSILQTITDKYKLQRCFSLLPQLEDIKQENPIKTSLNIQSLITSDPQLDWFRPIIQKHYLQSTQLLPNKFLPNIVFN